MVQPHSLVNVAQVDPRIQLDIHYATPHNFCRVPLYPIAACFLHKDTAVALKRVQDRLMSRGLFLKIFDGYRPLSVQQVMWDLVQDENYVMNPAKGKGRHTRGTAVDLTLVDVHGNELEMPSQFDDWCPSSSSAKAPTDKQGHYFTSKAHRINPAHSERSRRNMLILEQAMLVEGFEGWPLEWWHYDLQGWHDDERYPSLDIPLQELVQHPSPYKAYTEKTKPADFTPTVSGAGFCIIVEGHVLLLQRSTTHRLQPGTWGIPAGKIDPGETPLQAAIRETLEEAGIQLSSNIVEYRGCLYISVAGTHPAHIQFHVYAAHLQEYPLVTLEPDQVAFRWITHQGVLQLPVFTGTREVLELGMAHE